MRPDLRLPRVVLVTRRTGLELLVAQHGTASQARFYLESHDQTFAYYEEAHARQERALKVVTAAIPADQRRTRLDRNDIDRFLFAPDDLVVIVGQDGLVPNVAKYLQGQRTVGINPDPASYDGVLCRHPPEAMTAVLRWLAHPSDAPFRVERRVMAAAEREDGQRLLALNEVFVGHRSHQSARYRLEPGSGSVRQSSSGVIVTTGTGATGWALSISGQRRLPRQRLPAPEQARLAWFVREPFPSVSTDAQLDFGVVDGAQALTIVSEMGEGGVVFADGVESDALRFLDGSRLNVRVAPERLNLVVPATSATPTQTRARESRSARSNSPRS